MYIIRRGVGYVFALKGKEREAEEELYGCHERGGGGGYGDGWGNGGGVWKKRRDPLWDQPKKEQEERI